MTPDQRAPVLVAAAVGFQVGAAMVATRFIAADSGPATLALLRYGIGAACLLPVLLLRHLPLRFAARDLLPIAVLGILQFAATIVLLNYGLRHVPAGRGALLFACFPLLTMLFAALLGHERLTLAKTAGVLLTLLGVALALGESVLADSASLLGDAAVLAAAACGALCSVLYRPFLQRYDTVSLGVLAMLCSVGALLPLAAFEGAFTGWAGYSGAGWLAMLFIGFSSAGGFYGWLWALRRISPTRVTIFLGLSPVTAAILGVLLLGEAVTLPLLAGLVVLLAGLWLAMRPEPPR